MGGHCIGVDPYYLATKAEALGTVPEIIRASRRRNDAMPQAIASRAVKFLGEAGVRLDQARVGVFGVTFKENVPDTRFSKVFDMVAALRQFNVDPMIHDPLAAKADCATRDVRLTHMEKMSDLDLLILAVPHDAYLSGAGRFWLELIRANGVLMDLCAALPVETLPHDLRYWSL